MRVQSQSNWLVIFCTTNCRRGRGGILSRIVGKNTIFNEHPVHHILGDSDGLIIEIKTKYFSNRASFMGTPLPGGPRQQIKRRYSFKSLLKEDNR